MAKNNGDYWNLLGVKLFGRGKREVLDKVIQIVAKKQIRPYWIATVNTEFMVKAAEDKEFLEILQKTDLNVVDGIGLIWAKNVIRDQRTVINKIIIGLKIGLEIMRGKYREGLVPGVELMEEMVAMAEREGKSVYFFGGWGDRAERTAGYFLKKYPKLRVAGYRDEDFDFKTEADILLVARGMKKQEEWIEENLDKLKVKVVMGVGRSFDYYSGDLKRAPEGVRNLGFEWLYSLYKEPKRWKRQLALPKFVWKVLFG